MKELIVLNAIQFAFQHHQLFILSPCCKYHNNNDNLLEEHDIFDDSFSSNAGTHFYMVTWTFLYIFITFHIHFIFHIKKIQSYFVNLDYLMPYCTYLGYPIHNKWFILTIKPNEQYQTNKRKTIDYGHNKMNNTLIDESLWVIVSTMHGKVWICMFCNILPLHRLNYFHCFWSTKWNTCIHSP
jgi:hypothetical protein